MDAYDILFTKYNREDFFKDSIGAIIFIPEGEIRPQWEKQKERLFNKGELFIRGYGRDAKQTELFFILYKNLFPALNVLKDSTNNAQPTKLLSELTSYCKTTDEGKNDGKERIQNYQISHLFGRTKNPLLFTAAWNMAYVPKYLDPFTGHESQGDHSKAFKLIFDSLLRKQFSEYIADYNEIIRSHVKNKLEEALDKTKKEKRYNKHDFARFRKDAQHELSEI